jgi:hypothetical protein
VAPFTSAFKLIKVDESMPLIHSQVFDLTPLFSSNPLHRASAGVAKKKLSIIACKEPPERAIWILF